MAPRDLTVAEYLRSIDDSWMMNYGPVMPAVNTNSNNYGVGADQNNGADDQSETLSTTLDRLDTVNGNPPFRRAMFSPTPDPDAVAPEQPIPTIDLTEPTPRQDSPRPLKRKVVSDSDEIFDDEPQPEQDQEEPAAKPKKKSGVKKNKWGSKKKAKKPKTDAEEPAKRGRPTKKAAGRKNASNTNSADEAIAAEDSQEQLQDSVEDEDPDYEAEEDQEDSDEVIAEEEARASDGEYEGPRSRKKKDESPEDDAGGTSTGAATQMQSINTSSSAPVQQQSSAPVSRRGDSAATNPRQPNGKFMKKSK